MADNLSAFLKDNMLSRGDSIMTDICIKLFPSKDDKLCHRYHSFINLVGELEHIASLY